MIIDIIGTSCTWFKRNNTSYVIDKKIILDTPSGAYKDIIKVMDIFDAEAVIISHFHSDHFSDLMNITTQIMRHGKRLGRTEKLKVYGPKGIAQKLIDLNKVLESSVQECSLSEYEETVEFIEIYDGYEFEVGKYKVKTFKMLHDKLDAYGFVFDDKNGNSVGFTADSAMCDSVDEILKSANYAFIDMASPDKIPNNKHMNVDEFILNQKKYPSVKMFPIHTSDQTQEMAIKLGLNYLTDGQVLNLE